jgi:hypothetical protein
VVASPENMAPLSLEPMTTEALRELRDQLHAELSSGALLDPERRGLLMDVKAEIDRVIERQPTAGKLNPEDAQNLQGRLQAAAVNFEGSHPQLAGTLERALVVLSNMGL